MTSLKFAPTEPTQVPDDETLKRRAKHLSKLTGAEAAFSKKLKRDGVKFRTQVVIGFHIVDFLIPGKGLVIEVDGGYHDTNAQRKKDARRTKSLRSLGLQVIRIRNEDVEDWSVSALAEFKDRSDKYSEKCVRRGNNRRNRARGELTVFKKDRSRILLFLRLNKYTPITRDMVVAYLNAKKAMGGHHAMISFLKNRSKSSVNQSQNGPARQDSVETLVEGSQPSRSTCASLNRDGGPRTSVPNTGAKVHLLGRVLNSGTKTDTSSEVKPVAGKPFSERSVEARLKGEGKVGFTYGSHHPTTDRRENGLDSKSSSDTRLGS